MFTQWCVCTFLALFAAISISTIDANSNPKSAHHHHMSPRCHHHHKNPQCYHHHLPQHHDHHPKSPHHDHHPKSPQHGHHPNKSPQHGHHPNKSPQHDHHPKSPQHDHHPKSPQHDYHHKSPQHGHHHKSPQHGHHHKSPQHGHHQKGGRHPKKAHKYQTDIYVDPMGIYGGFSTIKAAIDSVPSNNRRWVCIHVTKGVYREQVSVPSDKPFIYLKGDGEKLTQVVWDAHDSIETSATFSTRADYTIVKGISFINSFNYPANATHNPRRTALATLVQGDKCAFFQCGFYGVQDTLWDVQGRHYFKECTIEGAIDFIFGAGQSHYEGCHISVIAGDAQALGFVTAQGRERETEPSGFVFKNCIIDGNGKTYLGRAWRDYARVVFYNTYMSQIVIPQGWEPWAGIGHENQLTFAENDCVGPGSNRSRRVQWAKMLSPEQLQQLTSISFIDLEGWINKLPSDFF